MPVSLSPGMTPSIKSDSAPNLSMLCLEPKGNKKGQHSLAFEAPELLALNFSFHSPSEKRLMFLRLASHYREAFSMMGEADDDATDITCGSAVKFVLFLCEIKLDASIQSPHGLSPYGRSATLSTKIGMSFDTLIGSSARRTTEIPPQ
jgi:hypothetical protein